MGISYIKWLPEIIPSLKNTFFFMYQYHCESLHRKWSPLILFQWGPKDKFEIISTILNTSIFDFLTLVIIIYLDAVLTQMTLWSMNVSELINCKTTLIDIRLITVISTCHWRFWKMYSCEPISWITSYVYLC